MPCERLNRSSLFVAALSARWPWVARGCHVNKCSLSLIRAVVFSALKIRLGPPTGLHTHMVTFWCSVVLTYSLSHNLQLSTGFTGGLSDMVAAIRQSAEQEPTSWSHELWGQYSHSLRRAQVEYPLLSDPNSKVCERCGAMPSTVAGTEITPSRISYGHVLDSCSGVI